MIADVFDAEIWKEAVTKNYASSAVGRPNRHCLTSSCCSIIRHRQNAVS